MELPVERRICSLYLSYADIGVAGRACPLASEQVLIVTVHARQRVTAEMVTRVQVAVTRRGYPLFPRLSLMCSRCSELPGGNRAPVRILGWKVAYPRVDAWSLFVVRIDRDDHPREILRTLASSTPLASLETRRQTVHDRLEKFQTHRA